jgi:hypothetical protein
MKYLLALILFAVAVSIALPLAGQEQEAGKQSNKEVRGPKFLPNALDDEWTRWIVGQWEGAGESTAGKGKGRTTIELGLNGQFLIMTSEADITELNSEYLKKNMYATDEEIERFRSMPFRGLEIHTLDRKTGEPVGYMFDSLRCIAEGTGKREGNKETMDWKWSTGHKSTRITEKKGQDKMLVIERTAMPDGSIMEDRGEMTRIKPRPASSDNPGAKSADAPLRSARPGQTIPAADK